MLFAAAIILVTVPFATLLFQVLAEGPLTRFDGDVADRLNDYVHARRGLVPTLRAISWLGSTVLLTLIVLATAAFTYLRGRTRLTVFVLVTCGGGGVVNTCVKLAVNRPRPSVDHEIATAFGKSFPSGHTMSSTIVYGMVLLVLLPVLRHRRARHVAVAVVIVLVAGIGSTRLLLGVHFVSDVLGGFVLGLAWLTASVAAFEVWRTDTGRRRSEPLSEGVEPEAGPALRGG